jgi:hypothetical protein
VRSLLTAACFGFLPLRQRRNGQIISIIAKSRRPLAQGQLGSASTTKVRAPRESFS